LERVVRRDGSQRPEEAVVLSVRANPEPDDDITGDDPECAVPEAHARSVDGSGGVGVFEVKARVMWVVPETAIGFTGPALDMLG
jgi:hypothetical protein